MLKLEIDSVNQSIKAEVLLKGEAAPIQIQVGSYDCVTDNDHSGIVLKDVHTSKEWLNTLFQNLHPDGLRIPMDQHLVSIVKGIL